MPSRNTDFQYAQYWPCTDTEYVAKPGSVSGALSYMNPTSAAFQVREYVNQKAEKLGGGCSSSCSVAYIWSSRNNRKGIHLISIGSPSTQLSLPGSGHRPRGHAEVFRRLCSTFPYYDISYLIGVLSTISSILWIIDGILIWTPVYRPDTEKPGQITYGGGLVALTGTCIFFVTSLLALVEATNENRTTCFGWIVKDYDALGGAPVYLLRPGICSHHQSNADALLAPRMSQDESNKTELESHAPLSTSVSASERFYSKRQWIPTKNELVHHYCRDLGFYAAVLQMASVVIYLCAAIPRLPGLYKELIPTTSAGLWVPKVVGGFFITASTIAIMLECQTSWFVPAISKIGWQVGLWSVIGSQGFTVGSFLGLYSYYWPQYHSALATIWGGFCFLIASLLMLFESVNKYKVEYERLPSDAALVLIAGFGM